MLLPCKTQSNHKDQNKMKDCPNNQNIQNPCYPHTTLQYATAKITNKHVALQNAPPYHEVHKKSAKTAKYRYINSQFKNYHNHFEIMSCIPQAPEAF